MGDRSDCVTLEVLDERECERLLAANHLGRLAVISAGAPMVVPVNYAWVERTVVFGSDQGTKRQALELRPVAFEIDDADTMTHTGWSVLVVGWAEPARGFDPSHAAVAPWCGIDDPAWIRIIPERVSGRRIVRRIG